ncbi:MAG: signal recognition particle-docking protein FtsY [Spirochaetia bacterium]|jgi:fused signal recognition particle receptor|nr:signal recognition particle-docking protein FtsY [Spirochaetia bacterium]
MMRFGERVRKLLGMAAIGDEDWDDLADLLVEGDLGGTLADSVVIELKAACAKAGVKTGYQARLELKKLLSGYLRAVSIQPSSGALNVVMLLGVNGVGKTTTAAKLASYWLDRGDAGKAILAAGDTFRAAAIEQLKAHGDRLGIRVVSQDRGSDSGAVLYDAIEAGIKDGSDLIIADTAGRMHTKQNLIKELEKMDKIVAAKADPDCYVRLLVVDATTGQNALRQAETFSEAVTIDGIVLTKYDSSAKGGVAIAIARQLGIPTAFICDGERYEDIRPFDPEQYLDEFLGLES